MVEMLNLVEKTTGVQAFLIPLPVVQPPEAVKSLFCFVFICSLLETGNYFMVSNNNTSSKSPGVPRLRFSCS